MEVCCHFTRRKKKSVSFMINHSHGVLMLTNRLLERNNTRAVLNLGHTQLWSSNSHTRGDVCAKALCRDIEICPEYLLKPQAHGR